MLAWLWRCLAAAGFQSVHGACRWDVRQGMSEHDSQQQAANQSGLVNVSAGATLYAFLCIFLGEEEEAEAGEDPGIGGG